MTSPVQKALEAARVLYEAVDALEHVDLTQLDLEVLTFAELHTTLTLNRIMDLTADVDHDRVRPLAHLTGGV